MMKERMLTDKQKLQFGMEAMHFLFNMCDERVNDYSYITVDYARTKRNVIFTLCLLLCVESVLEENLRRQLILINLEAKDLATELWKEICVIFSDKDQVEEDASGNPILSVKCNDGNIIHFEKNETLLYKRVYSVASGQFESIYTIENATFPLLNW